MTDLDGRLISGTADSFCSAGSTHFVERAGALVAFPLPVALPPGLSGGLADLMSSFASGTLSTRTLVGALVDMPFYSGTRETRLFDALPPVISGVSPGPGTPIGRGDAISFDVTDTSGLFRRIFVVASYASLGTTELVHDGTTFRNPFVTLSVRDAIAGGYHFIVKRQSGWPAAPTIEVFAIDSAGNEVA